MPPASPSVAHSGDVPTGAGFGAGAVTPFGRRLVHGLVWLGVLLYFVGGLSFLALRWWVLPGIDGRTEQIAAALGQSLGQPVEIEAIRAEWSGLRPRLQLTGLRVLDTAGAEAFRLEQVEASLSYASLLHGQPVFARLEIEGPTLEIRRTLEGRWQVGGIVLDAHDAPRAQSPAAMDSAALAWLLAQPDLRIRNARVLWHDERTPEQAFALEDLQLRFESGLLRHRLGLTANLRSSSTQAPGGWIDLRADLRQSPFAQGFEDWSGRLYLAALETDFDRLHAVLPFQAYAAGGQGSVELWFDFADGRWRGLEARAELRDLHLQRAEVLPQTEASDAEDAQDAEDVKSVESAEVAKVAPMRIANLHGRFAAHRESGKLTLELQPLYLRPRTEDTASGPLVLRFSAESGPQGLGSGSLSAGGVDLAVLASLGQQLGEQLGEQFGQQIGAALPQSAGLESARGAEFGTELAQQLAAAAPRGTLEHLALAWKGAPTAAQDGQLLLRARGLGMRAHAGRPGFDGLALEIEGNPQRGRFVLSSSDLALDLAPMFPEPYVQIDRLHAEGRWRKEGAQHEIALTQASFANADTQGNAHGLYWPAPDGPGRVDFAVHLTETDGTRVWAYMPRVVNDDTRNWLRQGITAGKALDARLRLHGDLAQFPFRDNLGGQFLVSTRLSGAQLSIAPDWPVIRDIDGELRFEGVRMRIDAERGRIFETRLQDVVAEIPDLMGGEEILAIHGRVLGSTQDFLRFIDESPVAERTGGFTSGMRAEGRGELALELSMPLRRTRETTVRGDYRLVENRVQVVPALPALERLNGRVAFTDDSLQIPQLRGRLFDQPVEIRAESEAGGGVRVHAEGGVSAASARAKYGFPMLDHLSGVAPWQAEVTILKRGTQVRIDSPLTGITSSLPDPLNKSALENLPLAIELDFPARSREEHLFLRLGGSAELRALRDGRSISADNPLGIVRAALGLQRPSPLPQRGLRVDAALPLLDLDAWRRVLLPALATGAAGPEAVASAETAAAPQTASGLAFPVEVRLAADELRVFGERLRDVELEVIPAGRGWRGKLASRDSGGEFSWEPNEGGRLHARLPRLSVGHPGGSDPLRTISTEEFQEALRHLPDFDVEVEDFVLRGMPLGRLTLQAHNESDSQDQVAHWQLEDLRLDSPDARLQAHGYWQPGEPQHTALNFTLDATDAGALLGRLGHPDALRGGVAALAGKVSWMGSPLQPHYPSLSGQLKLDASEGQFRQLEPGVGRLLGVLSLQALPRRISLDFRDVFSQGFAFDRLSGEIHAREGVLHTEALDLRGPSARVNMRGSVDLREETQNLVVAVQPTLTESIALGAAAGLINPVAGVITYLAQKTLGDPIERMFAFEYAITGQWDDPRVERLQSPAPTLGPAPSAPGSSVSPSVPPSVP